MVINTPKKHGYYTFTTIKPWLIFIRDEHPLNSPERCDIVFIGYVSDKTINEAFFDYNGAFYGAALACRINAVLINTKR